MACGWTCPRQARVPDGDRETRSSVCDIPPRPVARCMEYGDSIVAMLSAKLPQYDRVDSRPAHVGRRARRVGPKIGSGRSVQKGRGREQTDIRQDRMFVFGSKYSGVRWVESSRPTNYNRGSSQPYRFFNSNSSATCCGVNDFTGPERLAIQQQSAIAVENFGGKPGPFQRRPPGDAAVVGEQQRRGAIKIRHDRVSQPLRAGQLVRHERHRPEE